MCKADQPVIVSFIGGVPDDANKLIKKVIKRADGSLKTVLMRFSSTTLQCTGTDSTSQLSCYFPPEEYKKAKDIALDPTRRMRVHGAGSPSVAQAAWSNT